MLLNYLKLAFRLMIRKPFFTIVNVTGLSVGFAVFFVLWQYSQNELKSDQQWKDWERIVRCAHIWQWTDDGKIWSQSQFGETWPEIVKKVSGDFPEIEGMARIFRQENFAKEHIPFHGKEIFLTRINERDERISFKETSIAYSDPNLFAFFAIPLVQGNENQVLREANSIVLSQRMAQRYFSNTDPVNQLLLINNDIPLKVTGVFADLPRNTHLEFEAVISTVGIVKYIDQSTFSLGGPHAYFKLSAGTDPKVLEDKINSNGANYWSEKIAANEKDIRKSEFYLQPLSDVPFVNYRWDYFKPKSAFLLKVLAGISVLTLFIAWVNYLQLSISLYWKRIKEMGIRKTNGATLWNFIHQFILESFLINTISVLLALTLIQIVKYSIGSLFGFYIPDWKDIQPSTIIIFVLAFSTAVALSALAPIFIAMNKVPRSLLNRIRGQTSGLKLSGLLVPIQFGFSVVLIVWVFMVFFQVDFMLKANMGINRNEVVLVDLPLSRQSTFTSDFSVFMEKVKSTKGIKQVTFFSSITGDADNNMVCMKLSDIINHACVDTNGGVDENFIPFFGIKLLAGRNFRPDYPADSAAIILSRRSIQRLGIAKPEDAIGQRILVNTGAWADRNFNFSEIIGIVEDYYGGKTSLIINQGMGEGHGGIILTYKDKFIPASKPQKIALRVNLPLYSEVIREVEKVYNDIFPGQLCRVYFLDEQIGRFYDQEKTARNQILLFTIIAIGITCLGLLGMISNKVVEKTKEIGIRKVLGADLRHITQILLSTTIKQVIVATVIGIPAAYYLTQQYLQKFSVRVELQWWHYVLPIAILVVIMLGTVATVVWDAVKRNPVEALKYE